jgi:hypothetical protein
MKAFLSLFCLACLISCTVTYHGKPGSKAKVPGLLNGDRVTIDREFIYLDDPVFLQRKSVHAFRNENAFTFQLPIFFNANVSRQDTLRFGSGSITIKPGAAKPRKGDSLPAEPMPAVSCVADTGKTFADENEVARLFLDTGRALVFPPGRGGERRVTLNLYCRGYEPPRGRMDTLSLAIGKSHGPDGLREQTFELPFHVSYRGPVVSILVGVGLLYAFTQAGVWIADR